MAQRGTTPTFERDLFMDAVDDEAGASATSSINAHRTATTLPARSERAERLRERWLREPGPCFDAWMLQAKGGRGFNASSQRVYRSMWLKFIKHAPRGVLSGAEEIDIFLGRVGVRGNLLVNSLTQQRRYLALLAAVQDDLVAAGAIASNAAREILDGWNVDQMGMRRSLPVALTVEQEALVFERLSAMHATGANHWISHRDLALACLVLGSGLKVHELQKLRIRDVAFARGGGDVSQIRATTNGHKERRAPMAPQHEPIVRSWLEWLKGCGLADMDLAFPSHESDGKGHFDPEIDFEVSAWVASRCIEPMSAAHIWRVIHRLLGECGLSEDLARQGPTVLRNTFAVRQLRHGVPIEKVSLWLGHKDPRSTRVYEPLLNGHTPSAS